MNTLGEHVKNSYGLSERIAILANRLENIRTSLIGPVPTASVADKLELNPTGSLNELGQNFATMLRNLDRCFDAMQGIEQDVGIGKEHINEGSETRYNTMPAGNNTVRSTR